MLTTSFYAAPQVPADAKRLFEAACADMGLHGDITTPLPPGRGIAAALILSREWGLADLEQRLIGAIEASYEPTWDQERGEFTWGMGLNEEYPRGQFNAFLGAAEASGFGSWSRLSEAPLEPSRQIVGVDFPAVALSRAMWQDDTLHINMVVLNDAPHEQTSFLVTGIASSEEWQVSGVPAATCASTAAGLEITLPTATASFQVHQRS